MHNGEEEEDVDNETQEDTEDDDETTRESPAPRSSDIIPKAQEHNFELLKSVERILENVSKSYHAQARLLMKYLLDKAVLARISWNEHRVVTINGNVFKDSRI